MRGVIPLAVLTLLLSDSPVRAQSWEASGLVGFTPSAPIDQQANELEDLNRAIEALESQRSILGDEVVDIAQGSMREKLARLTERGVRGSDALQERAEINTLKVDEQKETLTRALDLELSVARKQYANSKQKMEEQQTNLVLAKRIFEATQTKFKGGVGSSSDVTQAQTGLLQAESSLIQSRSEFLKSIVDLRKALGKS